MLKSKCVTTVKRPPSTPLSVILYCAGQSRRMKSYGVRSLLPINGSTLIDYQIQTIDKMIPDVEIVVCVGYQSKSLIGHLDYINNSRKKRIKIVENENFLETTDARSVQLAYRVTSYKTLLVIAGDILFNDSVLNLPDTSCIVCGKMNDDKIGISEHNGLVTRLSFGLENKWAYITKIGHYEKDLLDCIMMTDVRKKSWAELLNEIIDANGKLQVISPEGMKVREIDSSFDLVRLVE